jgi:acyl-CoA thioesterase FadM
MHVQRVDGLGTVQAFESPVGSRNLWFLRDQKFSEPAGRLTEEGKIDLKAKHIDYEAPLTSDQKLAEDVASTKTENAALRAELEAMRAERDAAAKQAVVHAQASAQTKQLGEKK